LVELRRSSFRLIRSPSCAGILPRTDVTLRSRTRSLESVPHDAGISPSRAQETEVRQKREGRGETEDRRQKTEERQKPEREERGERTG
jgi:hypothetical protein